MEGIRLKPEVLKSLIFSSISGTYALVGALSEPSRIYFVQNLTNATLTFSQDGTNDHFVLPTGGFLLLDCGTNKGTLQTLSIAQGTPLYVKGTAGSGSVYLTSFYMG